MLDASLCAALPIILVAYCYVLKGYLIGLERPIFLEIGFLSSLLIGCLYSFNGAKWRYALIGCFVNELIFLCAVWLAQGVRHEYIRLMSEVKSNPGLAAWLGHDLHDALAMRYVGYAGCFAIGLFFARLMVGSNVVRGILTWIFILPVNRLTWCRCCGQCIQKF